MFWEIDEIPFKKIESLPKGIKNSLWFYSKNNNLYIEKQGLEYKSIIFKENNIWKRIILDEKNYRLRKDSSKLLWTRYKQNLEIQTILFPKEFVEVDEIEIKGVLSVIREQFRPKQRLSDGWYQWVEFQHSQEWFFKVINDKMIALFFVIEESEELSGKFISEKDFLKFNDIFKKLDESYKCCSKIIIDKLEEKFKEKYCI
jgi:hypothetical protein